MKTGRCKWYRKEYEVLVKMKWVFGLGSGMVRLNYVFYNFILKGVLIYYAFF